jgi:hypothetical protein
MRPKRNNSIIFSLETPPPSGCKGYGDTANTSFIIDTASEFSILDENGIFDKSPSSYRQFITLQGDQLNLVGVRSLSLNTKYEKCKTLRPYDDAKAFEQGRRNLHWNSTIFNYFFLGPFVFSGLLLLALYGRSAEIHSKLPYTISAILNMAANAVWVVQYYCLRGPVSTLVEIRSSMGLECIEDVTYKPFLNSYSSSINSSIKLYSDQLKDLHMVGCIFFVFNLLLLLFHLLYEEPKMLLEDGFLRKLFVNRMKAANEGQRNKNYEMATLGDDEET